VQARQRSAHRNLPVEKSLGRSAPDPQSIGVRHMRRGLIALITLIAHFYSASRHMRGLIALIALFAHFYLASRHRDLSRLSRLSRTFIRQAGTGTYRAYRAFRALLFGKPSPRPRSLSRPRGRASPAGEASRVRSRPLHRCCRLPSRHGYCRVSHATATLST
jgi:hypothetical protein